ncbi:hypothetical protein [Polaromonas sp.]|uniref:hypothetical protein n=1 Tax=Polaromonas sp. TaxID=1869339 RepID=UPI0027304AE1|nr:hypothetical protein [Polaromonas sp.]MDP1740803.1 hypothetical protein [Polaromonas sp.]
MEASDALVEKAPSDLKRGEGTNKPFFIMKIDLVGSTRLLLGKRHATYLKLAHTFLSTVDRITQDYGADEQQVEYAGDGLFAYFPAKAGAAEEVLTAAFYAKSAVDMMGVLGGSVGDLKPKCRIVIHYDTLTVARIGPRAGSILSAIGMPIHRVAKLEEKIGSGVGRATPEFRSQLQRENWKFLSPVYVEEKIPITPAPAPAPASFAFSPDPNRNSLAAMLGVTTSPPPAPGLMNSIFSPSPNSLAAALGVTSAAPNIPAYRIERKVVGYDLSWGILAKALS